MRSSGRMPRWRRMHALRREHDRDRQDLLESVKLTGLGDISEAGLPSSTTMSTATDSVFGMIEYSAPGCWEGTRAYGGRVVSLDLSIKKAGLSATMLETALNRVDDLA